MKVSIIIPTIGRETLSEVLQSILDMLDYSAGKVEVIVVGDGDFSWNEKDIDTKIFAGFSF